MTLLGIRSGLTRSSSSLSGVNLGIFVFERWEASAVMGMELGDKECGVKEALADRDVVHRVLRENQHSH